MIVSSGAGLPSKRLDEMREVFRSTVDRDGYHYPDRKPLDTSRDTGATIEFRQGHGGCDTPTRHSYTLERPGKEPKKIEIDDKVLGSASGVSVGPHGDFVVGRYYQGYEEGYALVQVPISGGLLDPLRRRGWPVSPKVLAQLPEATWSFDVGPDNSVAVAHDNQVSRWTKRKGLNPWLEFPQPVKSVEYLSDGGLAVAIGEGFRRSFYHIQGGAQTEVSFKELFPEVHQAEIYRQTGSVAFLEGAQLEERERFLESCDWLKTRYGWQTHRAVPGPKEGRVAVTTAPGGWGSSEGNLFVYDRATAQSLDLGPLHHPESQRPSGPALEAHSRLAWSQDGNWLVYKGVPKFDGAPVDVTVFATDGSGSHLVPGVRGVEILEEALSFRIPSGERVTLPFDKVKGVKDEPWYARARMMDLFDDVMGGEGDTIELLEDAVIVGDEVLPHREY